MSASPGGTPDRRSVRCGGWLENLSRRKRRRGGRREPAVAENNQPINGIPRETHGDRDHPNSTNDPPLRPLHLRCLCDKVASRPPHRPGMSATAADRQTTETAVHACSSCAAQAHLALPMGRVRHFPAFRAIKFHATPAPCRRRPSTRCCRVIGDARIARRPRTCAAGRRDMPGIGCPFVGSRKDASMSETIKAEVCVMGAGPVGGTLACRLAAAGVATVLVDRAALPPTEHPAFDGRAYAVAAGSRDLLVAAGVWDRLPVPPNPILDIRVSDGRLGRRPSRLHLHFDHHEAGADAGPFGWMVEARSLRMALNAYFPELPALRVFAPAAAAVERQPDGAVVHIAANGSNPATELRCRLVVAAEGRDSPLREAAGIPVTRLPYHQTGIVCAISHDRPHDNLALEHFLPSGPFAVAADGAEPGRGVGRRAERLRHRLDRAHPDRPTGAPARRRAVRPGDRAAPRGPSGRPPGRHPHGGAAVVVSAVGDAGAPLRRYPSGTGRRCGPRHPPDRGPGPEPGLPRCNRAGGSGDRGGGSGRGSGQRRHCSRAISASGGRTTC